MRKTRRPHPASCRHCAMVQEYRDFRALEIRQWEDGGFRNDDRPSRGFMTFKRWLQVYEWEVQYHAA